MSGDVLTQYMYAVLSLYSEVLIIFCPFHVRKQGELEMLINIM